MVQLYIGNGVWITNDRRRRRVQISVTFLQLLELFQLLISWQREHINDGLDLLCDFCGVIENLRLRFRSCHLLMQQESTTVVSCLAVGCPLIRLLVNGSLSTILHRVCLFAILVTAGIVHVEVRSRWQTTTFDFGS